MSDVKDKFSQDMAKDEEFDRQQRILKEKKLIIDSRRADVELERLAQVDQSAEIAKSTDFGQMSDAQIEAMIKENRDYLAAAKNRMRFINSEFEKVVPFFRQNLITIGAVTGFGKSTAVGNVVRALVGQTNPENAKRRRVAVITTEERPKDIYNRVTCMAKGWQYNEHGEYSPEVTEELEKSMRMLAKTGLIHVVNNEYNGMTGCTDTIEGLKGVFDYWIANNQNFDAVIIDYYQKICNSSKFPGKKPMDVLKDVSDLLDNYKNIYPAPIVVMVQLHPENKEKRLSFEERIKGSKSIIVPSTFAMEMITDKDNLTTKWLFHKSRFITDVVGKYLTTGYDYGRFVRYDDEFRKKVEAYKENKQQNQIDKLSAIKDLPKEDDDGNNN